MVTGMTEGLKLSEYTEISIGLAKMMTAMTETIKIISKMSKRTEITESTKMNVKQ